MSNVVITIETDNAAFEDRGFEVADILRDLAMKSEEYDLMGSHYTPVRDSNGNTVGSVVVE